MSYRTKEQQAIYEARDKTLPAKDVSPDKITGYTFKGEPIVLQKTRGRPKKGGIARAMAAGIFPEAKYVEAATLYAATGDAQKVSDLTNIPVKILKSWVRQAKFREILEQIREENDEKIDAKFTELVEGALDGLKDRIANGDYHYDTKKGILVRKPVSAKDLAVTTAINIDKRQLLRGKPTSRTETTGSGKRLEQLAEQFIKMTQGQLNAPIEVEYLEVIEPNAEPQQTP